MKILTRVILIILIQSGWLLAQEREWSISLMGGKEVSKVSLVTVREDSLIILQPGKLRSVSVDSIVKIGFDERGSRAVQGCAVGVVAGAGLGFLAGLITDTKNTVNASSPYSSDNSKNDNKGTYAFLGGAVGGILGIAIGASSGRHSYDMHQMSTDGKVTLIGSLLVKEGKAPFRASGVQDIVYLKNGSIIKGNVVNLIPDSTVKILTADSSVFICRMAEVERITKDSTHGLSSFSLRAQGPPRVSSPPPFKFSLRAGVAAPTGNFAATDSTGGAAQTGFLLGGNLRLAVDLTLDWMTDVTMSFNSVNVQAVSVPAGFTADFGSWFSIWALTDIRTKMPVSPNVSFFGTGQLGFLFGNSPELTLSGNGGRATVASASATSFAYGLGGGVLIENKFTVGVRFVHSEPEYTLHASGTGGTVSAKAKQSTSMMQVTAGIDF